MAERAVVRGTVIGDDGVPVAGWVSLGKKQPQRWLARELRIKSEDHGHEVAVEGLGDDAVVPVTRVACPWRELEQDSLAKLCAREAPAPDVEVDFHDAIVRGGDRVVAWGDVVDYGPVGGQTGDAFRDAPERGITRVAARVLAYGDDREGLADAARTQIEERDREEREEREKTERAEAKRKAKQDNPAPAKSAAAKRSGAEQPITRDVPLIGCVLALIALAVGAIVSGHIAPFVLAAATALWAPLALDAVLLPRFRRGAIGGVRPDAGLITWALGAVIAIMPAYGTLANDLDPGKAHGILILGAIAAGVAGLGALLAHALTRTRFPYLTIIAKAPPHPDPTPDNTWGASVGRFAKVVHDVGKTVTTVGSGKSAYGSEKAYCNIDYQAPLLREAKTSIEVRIGEAHTLTLERRSQWSAEGRATGHYGEIINERCPVIAVGRATGGVLVAGGEASLLVFAGRAGTDAYRELAQLRRRLIVGRVLALAGVATYVVGIVALVL